MSTSTHYARITSGRVMSAPRGTVWAFSPRVLLQQQCHQQYQQSHTHNIAPSQAPQPSNTGPTTCVCQRGARKMASPSAPSVGASGGSSSGNHTTTGLTAFQGRKPQSPHHVQRLHSVAHRIAPVVSACTDQLQDVLVSNLYGCFRMRSVEQ